MKLLHTSDWHLGAKLGTHSRLSDHRAALQGLLTVAEDMQPDLILHTGDLFDSSRPPYDAMQLGVRALARLSDIAPTVAICGNHDSAALLEIVDDLARLADTRQLQMVTTPQVVTVDGLDGVAVACVPFVPLSDATDVARATLGQFEGSYADAIRGLNDHLLTDAHETVGDRSIVLYAAHLHVHGARPGRSERRITVGEDYAVHAEGLRRAMYAALGHIHDPQLLPGNAPGRYAGSLIQMDFGEATQVKVALEITIDAGDVTVDEHSLPAGRPLVEFRGDVDELDEAAADGAFDGKILKARVHSEDPITDLAGRVLAGSPDCAIFEMVNIVENAPIKAIDPSDEPDAEPALDELFAEWRTTVAPAPRAPHDKVRTMFSRAVGAGDQAGLAELGVSETADRVKTALAALPHVLSQPSPGEEDD